jgi:hypothetical protein
VTIDPAVLAWDGGAVRRIAVGIRDRGSFEAMPVLADALLDAGCDTDELVRHCRSPGPHLRGCWALGCLLGG